MIGPALDLLAWLTEFATTYWEIGVFLASFLGSLIIFVPIPYYLLVSSVSLVFDPTIVAVVSASGATLAKTVIFQVSYMGRRLVSEATEKRLRPFERFVSRYGWIAAFLAAATPVPDDLIYVPLGLAHYDLKRFLPATLMGKLILTALIAWGSRLSLVWVTILIEGIHDLRIAVLSGAILIGVIAASVYAIVKLDWGKLLGKWFPWTLEEDDAATAKP